MDLGLKGRKALITSSTKGIGRAIADLLADEGANVAICARHVTDVVAAVEALAAKGGQAPGRALDVGDGPALTSWVADAAQELGGLDILVANVGDKNSKRDFSAGLAESQSPNHPWETPARLARGPGDGDWRRLYPAPPPGRAG